jgi:Protein of unknown function (DUF1553)/Protein of unknown function (DUF1549)/Planctomycete cytochrome C
MARLCSHFAILGVVLLQPVHSAAIADDHATYFENHVRPLLADHCIKCHGPDKQSGGLRLDASGHIAHGGDSGPVVVPGDADASLLIQAIRYGDDIQMPPDEPLAKSQIAALTQWVKAGAIWPTDIPAIRSTSDDPARTHWAFQPVRTRDVPDATGNEPNDVDFYRNQIDAFVGVRLQQNGLSHAPQADRRTLIRRVSYALTGLPPTNDDVVNFMHDESPNAYEQLVDRLLATPTYGQHWARHWLDVARYSDTKGYVYAREERFWVHAWAYRDWVVNALNDDMPYDRFLLLQIAADQVSDRSDGDLAAMGFLTLGRRFLGVQRDIIDDRIDVVTRGTMSLTVGCARCHDHKYDPIPTADYYSLYGVFASCRERIVPLASQTSNEAFRTELKSRRDKLNTTLQERRKATGQRVRQRVGDYLQAQFELGHYPEEGFDQILATTDMLPSFVRRWQRYLRRARRDGNPVFTVWHEFTDSDAKNTANTSGTVGAETIVPPGTNARVAAVFQAPPQSRDDIIQRYAALFTEIDAEWTALLEQAEKSGATPPQSLDDPAAEECRQVLYGPESPCVVPNEPIVHTEYDFDSAACNELWKLQGEVDRWIINAESNEPFSVVLEDRQTPTNGRIFKRGNPAQKGDEVPRQFLKLLSGTRREPFQHGSGRLELAQAIIDPHNPLTARVIVNRVWAHHFGTGMVATPGDFGTRAELPSHPDLLDWLSSRFVEDGWSIKALHRLILQSGTWRQSSTGPSDTTALSAAVQSDPENRLLWRMNTHRLSFEEMRDSILAASGELDRSTDGKPGKLLQRPFPKRRTLYGLVDRQFLPGTLRMFDFANPDLHIPKRSDTTVPQQALFLMNHPMLLEHAVSLAADAASRNDPVARVVALYERVLQRHPTRHQLAAAIEYLESTVPESEPPPPETAADWSYGYGAYDEVTHSVPTFTALPHFTGSAWQGGDSWPDSKLGWVQLTSSGGHPGNDRNHASIRRWTAPSDMTIRIESEVIHLPAQGDGIRVFMISSRLGLLNSENLQAKTIALNVDAISVQAGETIDFLCDIGDVLNSDQHEWRIKVISDIGPQPTVVWNSESDFTQTAAHQLTPLEQLAQVLLCSNEFFFVD